MNLLFLDFMTGIKMLESIYKTLGLIHNVLLHDKFGLDNKRIWTLEELIAYTGYSRQHILHLTSEGQIPFRKPNGKSVFFLRDEIYLWLNQGGVSLEDMDIDTQVAGMFTSSN